MEKCRQVLACLTQLTHKSAGTFKVTHKSTDVSKVTHKSAGVLKECQKLKMERFFPHPF